MRRPPILFWVLAAVVVLLAWRSLPSGDLWWHLHVGRHWLETGGLPLEDPFSWTSAGKRWTPHALVFDLGLAGVHRVAGLDGLRLLRGLAPALAALALAFLLRRFLPERPTDVVVLVVLAILPSALLMHRLRPYWIPLTLAPLAWVWIDEALQGRRPSLVLWFFGAWLWAGLHGSVILAVVMPGAALVLDARDGKAVRRLAAAIGLAVVASLLLPTSGELWLYAARLSVEDFNKGLVSEWQAPGLLGVHSSVQLSLLMMGLLAATRRRGPRWEWLWAAVWVLGYTRHMRQLGLALAALAPVAARGLAALRPEPTGEPGRENDVAATARWGAGAALLGMALLGSGVGSLPGPAIEPGFIHPEVDRWLVEAAPRRLFHQFDWGGYVPFRTRGKVQAFVDGRIFLHGERLVRDYLAIIEGYEGWQEALARYPIEAILLPAGHPCLDRIVALPGWREEPAPQGGVRLLVAVP